MCNQLRVELFKLRRFWLLYLAVTGMFAAGFSWGYIKLTDVGFSVYDAFAAANNDTSFVFVLARSNVRAQPVVGALCQGIAGGFVGDHPALCLCFQHNARGRVEVRLWRRQLLCPGYPVVRYDPAAVIRRSGNCHIYRIFVRESARGHRGVRVRYLHRL